MRIKTLLGKTIYFSGKFEFDKMLPVELIPLSLVYFKYVTHEICKNKNNDIKINILNALRKLLNNVFSRNIWWN